MTKPRFEKDIKTLRKRKKNFKKLESVLEKLVGGEALDPRLKNHPLVGNWRPCWELHIEPDWPLIYLLEEDKLVLYRMGYHSDLF